MNEAQLIDGKILAATIIDELKEKLLPYSDRSPGLATILVGDDPASKVYVSNKIKAAARAGIKSFHFDFSAATSETELLQLIDTLNHDDTIDGILVQLPLPPQINERVIIESIDPNKDVDGFHPTNLGRLVAGIPGTVACTPSGVIAMLKSINVSLRGKHAVVIGRSTIVGKPMGLLLLRHDATLTICHRWTPNLAEITKHADIVIVAVGIAKMINETHIKKGAIVIDVGINKDEHGKLCGDVDFGRVKKVASYISPVPGGVGPLTIAMLLTNTVDNFLRVQND